MPDEIDTAPETPPTVPAPAEDGGAPAVAPGEDASPVEAPEGAGADDASAEAEVPAPAPAKRPRGRPRKDGLPSGSPEAKAKDAGEDTTAGETPTVEKPPAEVAAPPLVVDKPKVREAERQRPKHARARPIAEQPKQETPKNVCTNVNCRAVHPSQGGKTGVRCVETGALVVAPMGREEGRALMKQILSWIGKVVSFAFGGEVSDPTDMEMGLITPPAIRIMHRFGIGEGNFTLDILMLLAGLSMYTMRVVQEARAGGQRVALPAAA